MTWDIEKLDLGAYLTRLGYDGPLTPTAGTLRAVHLAHVQAIPFENLDVLLDRGVRLDLGSLQDKLVTGGRGGYQIRRQCSGVHAGGQADQPA
ncbi:arylamine N-acetyltransferase [Nonomuraea sp. NPDC049480]|uniref:arylamine N-acetyltransferase n=1 Tax=Nonomuraea sp. NPDC049480 TaxID=3364353 RepID=UPI0037AEEA9C